jgi:hypothetical protein
MAACLSLKVEAASADRLASIEQFIHNKVLFSSLFLSASSLMSFRRTSLQNRGLCSLLKGFYDMKRRIISVTAFSFMESVISKASGGMTHLRITLSAGLLFAASAVYPGPMNQAYANFFDGNKLHSMCRGQDNVSKATCISYISATYDTLDYKNIFDHKFCMEGLNITALQISDIVAYWLKVNPQYRHYGASQLVAFALSDAFPCKN